MKNATAPTPRRRGTVALSALDPKRLRRDSLLVYDLMVFVRRYVVMPRERLIAVALWIVHTHCPDLADQTPYLSVTSPERQCGKSRLLDVLELLGADRDRGRIFLPAQDGRRVDLDTRHRGRL